jgi:RimJ/RimL family protein N-acetyltransferase
MGKVRKARLRDGTFVTLRPVRRTDIAALRSFLKGMSPESRYLRFHASVTDLSEAQWQYLVSADGWNHVAVVAWRGAVVVGVGRYIRLEDSPDKAEVAFAVTDAVQRRGLGTLLRDELVAAARGAGIRSFRAEVLAGNTGIRRLLRKSSMTVVSDFDNVLEVAFDQERPLSEPLMA